MNESADERSRMPRAGVWGFFVFVFCWTWFFWILTAATGTSVQTRTGAVLLFTGLLGPTLGGAGFTYLTRDETGRREYWSRIVDLARIPARWYLVIVLLPPIVLAVALSLDGLSGGHALLEQVGKRVAPIVATPSAIGLFLLRAFLYGPLPEELGWRGYITDRLQERWSALVSSLILGTIWGLWHLPLFFIDGMYHHTQGVLSEWFWLFAVQTIPTTVLFTWIFNNTRRSTLGAILFHFVLNVAYELGDVTPATNMFSVALCMLIAVGVVAIWGHRTLMRPGALKR